MLTDRTWRGRARRAAWLAAGVVVLLPIIVLVLAAAAVAAVTFAAIMLIAQVVMMLRAVFSVVPRGVEPGPRGLRTDGRRNVTVIPDQR